MADSDKNILITPQISQTTDPSIVFSSGATSGDDVTLFVTDDGTISTLSFEASSGQLFSISNDLTGIIFSVNDISGIPSIEVNADGTVSLAEFDGEVGIGTSAPTEMLHIQGRDVVSSNAGIQIDARGDAYLKLLADSNSDTELENAYVYFSQDATGVTSVIGTIGGANVDSLNGTFTGSTNNSLGIHHRFATGTVDIGVNGAVGLTVNDSNGINVVGTATANLFSGDGSSLTTLTAANISSGNLGSGVLPYVTANNTSTAYKLPFLNTTGTSSGNFGLLLDSSSSSPSYNPSTEILTCTIVNGTTSTFTTYNGALSGNATTATNVAATGVTAGNLISTVLPYATASTTASAFKIPFLNTTGNTSGNFGLLLDDQATTFTYNPSTNTVSAGAVYATNFQASGSYIATTAGNGLVCYDSVKAAFGLGVDMTMYHSGTHNYIDSVLATSNLYIRTNSTENAIVCTVDGAVTLYHNANAKFRTALHTTSDGGTGADVVDGIGTYRPVGFNTVPVYEIDAADTFDLAHNGMLWHKDAGGALSFTCASDTTIPVGATYLVHNDDTEDLTITGSTATVYWLAPGAAPASGDVLVEQGGIVTVYKYADAEFWVWGSKAASTAANTTITTSTTSSAFKVPFANTTASTTGDYGMLQDSTATFTYNPSTNTFNVGTITLASGFASGQIQADGGFLGSYDDAPSASYCSPIWGMDDGYTGVTGGLNALPTSCYGMRWNRASSSNAHADIGEGLYVYTAGTLEGGIGTAGIYSAGTLDVVGLASFEGGAYLGDSDVLQFGVGDEASMYSNGTDMYTDLRSGGDWRLRHITENMIVAIANGAVTLYQNGVAKITTTTTGVNISSSIFLNELTNAAADVTADGQIWVKNNAPNDLYFTNDVGVDYPVGYATYRRSSANVIDNINQTLNMTTDSIADAMVGGAWIKTNTTAYTLTLEPSTDTQFPVGSQIAIYNRGTSGIMTVTEGTGTTLWVLDGSAATDAGPSATIAAGGYATLIRESTTIYVLMGAGVTP